MGLLLPWFTMVKSYSDMLLVPFAKYLKKYGQLELSNLGHKSNLTMCLLNFQKLLQPVPVYLKLIMAPKYDS